MGALVAAPPGAWNVQTTIPLEHLVDSLQSLADPICQAGLPDEMDGGASTLEGGGSPRIVVLDNRSHG